MLRASRELAGLLAPQIELRVRHPRTDRATARPTHACPALCASRRSRGDSPGVGSDPEIDLDADVWTGRRRDEPSAGGRRSALAHQVKDLPLRRRRRQRPCSSAEAAQGTRIVSPPDSLLSARLPGAVRDRTALVHHTRRGAAAGPARPQPHPAWPLRRPPRRRAGLRPPRQDPRRPAVRVHQPALRMPNARGDDESALRARVPRLHDPAAAATVIDRVVHHAIVATPSRIKFPLLPGPTFRSFGITQPPSADTLAAGSRPDRCRPCLWYPRLRLERALRWSLFPGRLTVTVFSPLSIVATLRWARVRRPCHLGWRSCGRDTSAQIQRGLAVAVEYPRPPTTPTITGALEAA